MEKPVIQNLRNDIDYLLELNVTFHKNFTYGKSSWAQWGDYQNWINFNILSLKTIKNLSSQALYREAFILTRSVFESYFLIKLTMLAKYVYFNYLPYKGESKKDLLIRVEESAGKIFGDKNVKRIKLIENAGRPYKVEVIYKLKPVKDSEKTIPRHYFFFKEFDADYCYLSDVKFRDSYGTRERKKEKKIFHKNINKEFLNMPSAIMRFLDINKMATKRQRDAILVHYNFLSQFAHGSASSYEMLSNNHEKAYLESLNDAVSHDYQKKLLVLLYTCHMAIYFFELQVEYFSGEEEIKINNLSIIKKRIEEIKSRYYFFWFIYNQPSEYDIYQYKMQKIWAEKEPIIKNQSDINYYRNPLARLRDMNGYWENQIIGKYEPPAILK